jgi:hypothetical protein
MSLNNIVLYHINAANYDFLTPERTYADIAIGYVHHEKFIESLSGITTRRLTVVDCEIPGVHVFPEMSVTEALNINDISDTDGAERILGEGAKFNGFTV